MADETTLNLEVRRLRSELDDYRESVKGLYAFAGSACWHEPSRQLRPESLVSIPRKMTVTAAEGEEAIEKTLTPDGVVQVASDYGIVVEMRKHYRQGDTTKLDQIKAYDNDLIGWWTTDGKIKSHDLVLLTHLFSSVDAKDAYDRWRDAAKSYDRPFAIVEFGHADQGERWYLLRRIAGTASLTDTMHDDALRKGKKLGEEALVFTTQKYEFYDDRPPLIHMLLMIQQSVLPVLFSEEQFDSETGGSHPRIQTSVSEICMRLRELHCDPPHSERQPLLPKPAWVKEALETYVKMGLAGRLESNGKDQRYEIILRSPREKDFVRYFARKLLDIRAKPNMTGQGRSVSAGIAGPEQHTLFPDLRNDSEVE